MSDVSLTWEEVAHTYGRKVYNFAYRLTGNRADASDLAQDVLIRVNRGLAGYQLGSFDGWLWRITRNVFVDEIRRQKRRPTVPLPDEPDRLRTASSPAPDVMLAQVTLGEEVQDALLSLTYDFREAVVLCDVVGLSYDEIAQAVGVPVGTIRSRIHRGRKMLRSRLA